MRSRRRLVSCHRLGWILGHLDSLLVCLCRGAPCRFCCVTLLAQVLLDGVELALPQLALTAIHAYASSSGSLTQPQAVRAPVDHPHDRPRLLEHLQVLADRRLGHAEVAASPRRRSSRRSPSRSRMPRRIGCEHARERSRSSNALLAIWLTIAARAAMPALPRLGRASRCHAAGERRGYAVYAAAGTNP